MLDYRDIALADAALDYVELRARVRDLEAERDTFREILHAALLELHALTKSNARLRPCLRRDLWIRYGCDRTQKAA